MLERHSSDYCIKHKNDQLFEANGIRVSNAYACKHRSKTFWIKQTTSLNIMDHDCAHIHVNQDIKDVVFKNFATFTH